MDEVQLGIGRTSIARRWLSRRSLLRASAGGALVAGADLMAARRGMAQDAATPQASPAASPETQTNDIIAIAAGAMEDYALNAVILRVTIAGREVVTQALGESMTGVPATPDMHFRNGAVAISYIATLLLRMVDQGKAKLDD